MKKILLSLLTAFTFSCSAQCVQRSELPNGIDLIAYENNVHQAAVIGIIFDTGGLDVLPNNYGALRIILSNILNKSVTSELEKHGISCRGTVYKEYSEIVVIAHPKDVTFALQLICKELSNFSLKKFDLIKKKIILENKLSEYCYENSLDKQMNAAINIKSQNTRYMFNEQALQSLSYDQVMKFYHDVFEKNHLSIIVCGAVNFNELSECVNKNTATFLPRKKLRRNKCIAMSYKDITVSNKFLSPSLYYVYNNIYNDETGDFVVSVFMYQLSDFLVKSNCHSTSSNDCFIKGDNVFAVELNPKVGTSLNKLACLYEVFVNSFVNSPIPHEEIAKITTIINNSNELIQDNLWRIYEGIKTQLLSHRVVTNKPFSISQLNEEQIRQYFKEKIQPSLICKITTKHKMDE